MSLFQSIKKEQAKRSLINEAISLEKKAAEKQSVPYWLFSFETQWKTTFENMTTNELKRKIKHLKTILKN